MDDKVKATIKTKYSEITVESDRQTIQDIIHAVQRRDEFKERFLSERNELHHGNKFKKNKTVPLGAIGAILKAKGEGFFKEKRSLADIQKELEKNGFIYPNTTLSPLLLKLVRRGELGRLSEGGTWVYVQR